MTDRIDAIRARLAAVDANPVPIAGDADARLEAHAEDDIRLLLAEIDKLREIAKLLDRGASWWENERSQRLVDFERAMEEEGLND